MSFKSICITDSKYFQFISQSLGFSRGSIGTLKVSVDNCIPVYTAAKSPIAFINEIANKPPIIASSGSPIISFATNGDGSAGRNFIYHDKPFYINRDRIALRSIVDTINLHYVLYQLRDMKTTYGFDHHFKANKKNLECVEIDIPIDEYGNIDMGRQEIISNKWGQYKRLTQEFQKNTSQMERYIIVPNIKFNAYKTVFLDLKTVEFITHKLGFTQAVYRKLDTMNPTDIPIFTAKLRPVAHIKALTNSKPIFASAKKPTLSLADDGDGTAGRNIILHDKPYYQNTSRISFRILDENIVPLYVYYAIRAIKPTYGFGYQYKAKRENLMEVSLDIPCLKNGNYDIEMQKTYVKRCKELEALQTQICNLSKILCTSSVNIT